MGKTKKSKKLHVAFAMVGNGQVPREEKWRNDKADKAADKGAMKEDERLHCLAEKHSHKQRMYRGLMIRIQKSHQPSGRQMV